MEGGQRADTGRTQIDSLCSACVRGTGADGGGVSVLSSQGTPVLVHATDDVSRTLEDLQFKLGEGPCIEAAVTGTPVLVPDLADVDDERSRRWPAFFAEAASLDARALFAFPIRVGEISLGTVDLYRRAPGALDRNQVGIGLRAVAAVGSCLLAPDPRAGSGTYPLTVHRAAGMAMIQLGTGIDEALVRLRATAYLEGMEVTSIAAEVLDGRRRFVREAL